MDLCDVFVHIIQSFSPTWQHQYHPDSKVHGASMGPTWGRQDPGGPHVGHMNLAIWAVKPKVMVKPPGTKLQQRKP